MAEAAGALLVRIGADIGDFIDGLDKADKAVGKFSTTLDRRLLQPLAKVAAAAGTAATGLFMFAKSASDTVDQIGKLSQKVGVSVESLSALKYAAELSDVSLDQLGQGLKQLSKYMVENNVQGVSVEEQLLRIADQFEKTADGVGKTAISTKYFGKTGNELIPMLNQGRAGIEALRKEAERLGVIFSTEAARKAEEFNDNLTRLKTTATGLHVEMAGPFVKAFNEAAKSLMDAKLRGDGFFETMSKTILLLTQGTDVQIAQKRIVGLTDALLDAQKEVDEKRREMMAAPEGLKGGWAKQLEAAEARVKRIKDELEKLIKVKDVLSPPETAAAPDAKKPELFAPPFDQKETVAREQAVRDAMHRVREDDDKRELDQIELQNKAKLDAQALADQQYLEMLVAVQDEADRIRREEAQGRFELEEETERRIYGVYYKHRQLDLSSAKTFFGSMAGLMNSHSRKMFEIGKAGAIGETIINTYTAAMAAYKALAGIPVVGPALGAAAAAAAVATGLANVQAIRSQSFGGGSGASPVFSANASTGIASGQPGGDVGGGARGPDTVVHLHGETFGRKQVRALLEQITEEGRDGGRVVLAN